MIRQTRSLPIIVLCVLAAGCADRLSPADMLLRNRWVGNIDKIKLREPSGIVYHPTRGTLLAVGDEGDICEIRPDGAVVRKQINEGPRIDYEGITVDPATGLLYAAIEGAEMIVQIDPDTLETLRRFQLDRTFNGAVIMDPGGQGIEGITFVADADHPEGGTFYVSNQSFDVDDPNDISAILEIELPLKTASGDGTGRTVRIMKMPIIDLSGLQYETDTQRLLVASDATNTLWVITLDGRIERGYALIGQTQEGITVDPDGHLYIAQDSGGIIKIRWLAR